MRKILYIAIIACLLIILVPTSGFAEQNNKGLESVEYEYEYKGVNFTSTTPMSEAMIKEVYRQGSSIKEAGEITPFALIGGNEGRITHGPVRKSYTNNFTQQIVDVSVAWFMSKVPVKITKSTLGNLIFNKVTGWAKVQPTYIEYWNWQVYVNSNCKRNYSTIARYSNSSYSKMTDVYQVDVGLDCSY